jgi:hypothetical protein
MTWENLKFLRNVGTIHQTKRNLFEKGNRIIRGVRILKHSEMKKLVNSFWDGVPYFNEVTFKGVLFLPNSRCFCDVIKNYAVRCRQGIRYLNGKVMCGINDISIWR